MKGEGVCSCLDFLHLFYVVAVILVLLPAFCKWIEAHMHIYIYIYIYLGPTLYVCLQFRFSLFRLFSAHLHVCLYGLTQIHTHTHTDTCLFVIVNLTSNTFLWHSMAAAAAESAATNAAYTQLCRWRHKTLVEQTIKLPCCNL